jgi:hypothetical protein
MEQPPKIRDHIKDVAAEWRWKAQIGDGVVNDCEAFGISVWQRNKNGVIERLDPTNVVFSARPKAAEIPSDESKRRRFDAGVEEVHQQFLSEKRSEWERPQ